MHAMERGVVSCARMAQPLVASSSPSKHPFAAGEFPCSKSVKNFSGIFKIPVFSIAWVRTQKKAINPPT